MTLRIEVGSESTKEGEERKKERKIGLCDDSFEHTVLHTEKRHQLFVAFPYGQHSDLTSLLYPSLSDPLKMHIYHQHSQPQPPSYHLHILDRRHTMQPFSAISPVRPSGRLGERHVDLCFRGPATLSVAIAVAVAGMETVVFVPARPGSVFGSGCAFSRARDSAQLDALRCGSWAPSWSWGEEFGRGPDGEED